jgi:Protein of unknown function (DUF3108)
MKRISKSQIIPMLKNPFNSFKSVALFSFVLALMAFTPRLSPPQVDAQSAPVSGTVVNSTFQAGEELTYKVYYNLNFVWIAAGEVTFKIEDLGQQYHINATGRTYSGYEWFFKARDNYDTYIDKTTMLPTLSVRDIHEGKYHLYSKVMFDQKAKTATYERGSKKGEVEKKGNLDMKECMHDILSTVYYCRTLNYDNAQAGQSYPVKVMLDEEIYPLQYKFLGREEKKIKELGKWSTIKFTPQVVSGAVFKEGASMKIWASADANKVPLMIESPVSVGTVKVVLKSWKNLKYDTTAKKE